MATHPQVEIPGTEARPLRGAKRIGQTPTGAPIEVTLVLRPRGSLPDPHEAFGATLPHLREYHTQEQLQHHRSAREETLSLVETFAQLHGLKIKEVALERRAVTLTGTAEQMAGAFGVEFIEMEHERGGHRQTTGAATITGELAEQVQGIFGLHTRPCAGRPGTRHIAKSDGRGGARWNARELAAAYGITSALNGRGQCIGLIELGGGFHSSDIEKFFRELKLPVPKIHCVSVGGVKNSPAAVSVIEEFVEVVDGQRKLSSVPDADLRAAQSTVEVTMDIELAGAFAPGAEIVVYFASSDEQGIYNAISCALADKEHNPSVLSLSWGEPEPGVSEAYLRCIDELLQDAAHLGVTVCASSGDEGAMNNSPDDKPAVNFPASSPHVLSCGGTTVRTLHKAVESEVVWNSSYCGIHGATGGGVSRTYQLPGWQRDRSVPLGPTGVSGRGVPDVAGPADPHCGCEITVGGQGCASAGTSAVVPLWAALISLLNQATGARCGFMTPLFYHFAKNSPKAFREITSGNNGGYSAGPGWNPCTGLGTPVFEELLRLLNSHMTRVSDRR